MYNYVILLLQQDCEWHRSQLAERGLLGYFYFMSKCKIDYAFKSYVIKEHSDLIEKAKKSKYLDYMIEQYRENGVLMPRLERYNDVLTTSELFAECIEKDLHKELYEAFKINEAYWKRQQRLRQRINDMLLLGPCLFLTLTFNDDALQKTTPKQRRVAVSRYLKQFDCKYIANIDFGFENHREHYHAVIQSKKIDLSSWHKYGGIKVEKVRNNGVRPLRPVPRERLNRNVSSQSFKL